MGHTALAQALYHPASVVELDAEGIFAHTAIIISFYRKDDMTGIGYYADLRSFYGYWPVGVGQPRGSTGGARYYMHKGYQEL
jgi:hypothetical protein